MRTEMRPDTQERGFGWGWLVRSAGVGVVVLLAAAAAGLGDVEAAAFAAGGVVALLLLRFRTGLLGLVALGVLFADVAAFMVPGAISNLTHNEGWISSALPSALALVSLAGLVGVAGSLLRRRRPRPHGRGPAAIAVAALALLAAANIAGAAGELDSGPGREGDLSVDMGQVRFDPDTLEAQRGTIGVVVSNSDLFWHTFTIRELGVDLRVPVQGSRRIEFDAGPGTYEFVCAIPGHTQAGMKGELIVR